MSSDGVHMVCNRLAERTSMTKFKLFSAALIVSAAIATPALAERLEVIQEPGLYAFYHPNGDLGLGASRPTEAMAQSSLGGEASGMRTSVRRHPVSHASSIKHY